MTDEYIKKGDILRMIDLHITRWSDLKGKEQDVTQENFIDNVLLVLEWIMNDIEKL